ncbi:unnamed protein product, partial [Onchocerca ochengi]
EPWFDRIPRALSAADMYWLRTSAAVFHCAAELFAEISKRIPSEKIAEATTTNYSMMASKNLVFYTNIVFLFHNGGLLPLKNYTALNARMKAKVDERKKRLVPNSKLYVVNLLEEMQSACPNEIFWCGLTADEWYPPNSIGALLSAILAMKITETSKYRLIGYFLLDYDDVMGKEPKVFDRFKWRFPYKNRTVCDQIELNWRNDCGLEGPFAKRERITITNTKAEEPICEVDRLMKRLLLNKKEIEFIKENLLKKPNGIREWNRFCLRRKMFARLLPPEKSKSGILLDRCDRWTAKILEDFPIIQMNDAFPRSVFPTVQNSVDGGKVVKVTPAKQWTTSHPYLSPALKSHDKYEVLETKRRLHDVVPKSIVLEKTPKPSNLPTSPVYDRRISNYERILPKEDLENVHRLLQTPTPRRRYAPGIRVENSFASPTVDQFPPISLPASILKTRKERQHESTLADVTDSQFKSLRFDLPNSVTSNCESSSSNTSQMEEEKCGNDPLEMNNADALDAQNSNALKFMHISKKVSSEKYLELQDELEILVDEGEKRESTDATNEKNLHKISVEEQSDLYLVENQERQDEDHEKVVEHYFEEQEEIENVHDKTEPSTLRSENTLIQKSYTAPVTVSYEEQEDPGILLDAVAQDIISDVHTAKEQNIQDVGDLSENTLVRTCTKISRHASTVEVEINPRSPKKRSDSSINDVTTKSEDNITSSMGEFHKKVSYEQEDESDPTSTEIEKGIICHFEMEPADTCKELNKEEDRENPRNAEIIPEIQKSLHRHHVSDASSTNTDEILDRASSTAKDGKIEFLGSISPSLRKRRPKDEDFANDGQAIRIYSSDSFQSSSSDSEISTSSHRMLTRSATKKTKLVSLSPEVKMIPRKHLKSGTSSPPQSRETTPRRSTRATSSVKSSPKTEKTRRKRAKSKASSSCSRETTPKRSIRTTPLSKSSPKTEKTQQKRPGNKTSSLHSRETTPRRSTRATPSADSSPNIEETPRKRRGSRRNSTDSFEATPERSIRATTSSKSSPVRKSRRSRTQSEQIEVEGKMRAATPKASPNRRRRAISEESQISETSVAFHPMLTRSAKKAKSESGSPYKKRTLSGFEPTLTKIDEVPKKRFLRAGRKTVAQVLEEKMK